MYVRRSSAASTSVLCALMAVLLLGTGAALPARAQAEPPPGNQEIRGVSCASTTMCMAVGKSGKYSVIEVWDGTAWSLLQSREADIRKISCASTAACIAVGASSAGTAQSWLAFEQGGSWAVLEMAPPVLLGIAESALNSIDCTATTCTAVGYYKSGAFYYPLVERWNGSSWSQQFPITPLEGGTNLMLDISCPSDNFCMAVGEFGGKPFAESWNGLAWQTSAVLGPAGASGAKLAAVSCLSASSCVAVGDYFESAGNEKTLAESWNGNSWSILPSPNPSDAKGYVNFTDVSCVPFACFAVGYYASSVTSGVPLETKTLAASWNGTTWATQPSPNVAGKPYNALLGVSCASTSACTAVGGYSEALLGGGFALAERWNGSAWSLQAVVPSIAINDSATVVEDASATAIDVLSNDSEAVPGGKEIVAKTNGSHGSVSITGGGAGLSYQPAANYCGADSFTYTLNGGSTATVSITVTCVDDPPVAVNDTGIVIEDSGANGIDVLANDTDVDGGPKTVASKSDPAHGTLILIGGGAGLTYSPNANYCGADSFTYTLNAGSTATVSITVTCVDDAPVAVGDSKTLNEDSGATAIDVLANDTDVDSGPKAIQSAVQPAHGTVSITGGGTGLTYQPAADYCGFDSFTYSLNGGSSATVSITVTCVDDLPTAVNDSITVNEDSGATTIDALANDTDPDGGTKTIASKTDPAHGTVAIAGGGIGLTYAPAANYCGADSFTYTLNGGSSATVSVTVTCVDDAPVAVNDSKTVSEDASPTAIDVLANDTDVDSGPKAIQSAVQPAHGTVAITGGGTGLTYQPAANYCGTDSFTYTLNGGSTATVSVDVTCVDDPPVAVNDTKTLNEDSGATAIDVLANDTDPDGGPISVLSTSNGSHGTVVITGGGTGLTYAPAADYCGPDTFTYSLNGGSTATVSVTVTCVDDPPIAVSDTKTVVEDSGATAIDVLANDTDPDGGTKNIASKTDPAHGTVAITGGGNGLTYQPAADYCGADSFTYTLNGGSTATVSVTVTCTDDPPVAVNDSRTVSEDASPTATDVLANDTDIDGGSKLVISLTQPAHGAAAITGGGTELTYAPAANYCGSDAFTYTLNGGSTATVSITVTCVDDPPIAINDSDTVIEDSGPNAIDVLANDTDIDDGPKAVAGKTNGSHGAVALLGAGAGLTYQPAPDYCGPDAFTYTLNGGSTATVSITVTCVDEPAAPEGGGQQQQPSPVIQAPVTNNSSGPVVNVTPGVGVVSGRRHPRIAIKGDYAFFTLTCKVKEGECAGTVSITATIPSLTLGPTTEKVALVKGKFRIGAGRSVLVRARLTKRGRQLLETRKTLRGIASHMAVVDTGNGEQGEIDVNLVRRPKASLLGGTGK
jgi:hypothetical protein